MENAPQRKKIWQSAQDYFSLMAESFPTLCLSDEFYFFPRAKRALGFLDRVDDLSPEKIKTVIAKVKRISSALNSLKGSEDLETSIDLRLVNQSISTFLREFDERKAWQTNPNLYLKIILLGLEQIMIKAPYFKGPLNQELLSRLRQVPRLVNQAKNNLKSLTPGYKETSLEMIDFSLKYLSSLSFETLTPSLRMELRSATTKAILNLDDLKGYLGKKPLCGSPAKGKDLTLSILKDSFSYQRGLEEIFEIASLELKKTLAKMDSIAKSIDPKKNWPKILAGYQIRASDTEDLLELYRDQIEKIKTLLKAKDILTIPKTSKIIVRPTPYYMRPVRASASYACPISQDVKEPGFFYITPSPSDIHQEYIFVTAHETFPGHHLLDSIRKNLKNPIRAQIESPLFYEGWSSYAEGLINSLGYIRSHPAQKLIGLKRQAWRAVRAMLDSGIKIKKIDLKTAQEKLTSLGYEPQAVKLMLRHYLLTPGYQLCYTIGKFELERLKNRYAPKMGVKSFHDTVLRSGQIPFDLLEEKLKIITCPKKTKNS